jgi:lysophospholipase L1-like esterase
VDFITDSPKFEAVFVGRNQQVRVSINGQLMSAQAGMPTAGSNVFVPGGTLANDGNTWRLLFDFAGVRVMRSIRLEVMNGSITLQGLQLGVTDTLIPGVRRGPRVILMDDSMGESTGATDPTTGLTQILAQLTGWDVWPCAYGGTGYVNPGTRSKAIDHIGDVLNNAPDLVVWFLGINDYALNGGASIAANKAAIQAQALACYQKVSSSLPNVPQVALGPEGPTGNIYQNVDWMACRDAIKAAALAAGIPFADPLGTGYLKGTGKTTQLNNDGNADILVSSDGTHPSNAGHLAYAWVVASVIAAAING